MEGVVSRIEERIQLQLMLSIVLSVARIQDFGIRGELIMIQGGLIGVKRNRTELREHRGTHLI